MAVKRFGNKFKFSTGEPRTGGLFRCHALKVNQIFATRFLMAIAVFCYLGNHVLFAQSTNGIVKDAQDKSLIASLDERKLQHKVKWAVDEASKTEFITELTVSLVDDNDLEAISQFRRLRVLSCIGIISSDGIGKLLKLKNLNQLSISSSKPLSNTSIAFLGKMDSIQRLDIRSMQASGDIDLQPLANLVNLRHLKLPMSKYVDDDEIEKLSDLTGLVWLHASDCDISDAGVDSILKLKQLEALDIAGTKVSNQGVAKLTRLTKLRYLNVDGIRVSDKTVDALKNANDNDIFIIPYSMTRAGKRESTGTVVADMGK